MAKKIKQYRYYDESNALNAPTKKVNSNDASLLEEFANGSVFKADNIFPITQLGIQALPGTEFYLNGSIEPIIIGSTGIYDLDLKEGAYISWLSFNAKSLQRIRDNGSAYLIVDVLYEGEK